MWEVREGDALTELANLDPASVQTCITSPPYWGLRDYGDTGQLGLEPTPEQYMANLVEVFRQVRRVLRDDGTLWLNLGDSYAGNTEIGGGRHDLKEMGVHTGNLRSEGRNQGQRQGAGLKPKDLVGIPWRVAFALQADGWYLRSDIIWSKPNPMPESVTDRPTKAHEYLFLLAKSPRYFYDADAIREEGKDWSSGGPGVGIEPTFHYGAENGGNEGLAGIAARYKDGTQAAGRNRRSVWTVTTQPYSEAHFATFPPKLVEPCVLAGSPPKCCGECGAPWERVTERTSMVVRPSAGRDAAHEAGSGSGRRDTRGTMLEPPTSETIGWRSTCDHADDSGSATVLDPFAGSGTTGLVALRHNRSFVGIELNPDYCEMARNRIRDDAPLFNVETEV